MIDVAIVGAGIAGISCARRLAQAGLRPVLLDKGRGIGGRVATRRAAGLQFDHGAQYVTARGEGFGALLRDLAATGAVGPWQDDACGTRLVGIPGMSALAKAMAAGLDVRQEALVTRVAPAGRRWVLRVADAEHEATRVVVTVPAPQVAGILGADHPLVAPLAAVRLAPCLTLMAAVAAPAPFVSRSAAEDPLAWISQDGSKPGRPAGEAIAWVAQAGTAFSEQHLEKDAAAVAELMLPLLCDRLGAGMDSVRHASAHRWRYARVVSPLGRPFLAAPEGTLHLGGDWCVGPRVEDAWTSGLAIAEDILRQTR